MAGMKLLLRALGLVFVGLLAACAESATATPSGNDTFAITVRGVEETSDTPEQVEAKLKELFQKKAQAITEGRHYERFELVSFQASRETGTPIGRGTIRCFK
jgi:hypothetical protein